MGGLIPLPALLWVLKKIQCSYYTDDHFTVPRMTAKRPGLITIYSTLFRGAEWTLRSWLAKMERSMTPNFSQNHICDVFRYP